MKGTGGNINSFQPSPSWRAREQFRIFFPTPTTRFLTTSTVMMYNYSSTPPAECVVDDTI